MIEAYPQTPADSAALLAERRAQANTEPLTVFYPDTGEYVDIMLPAVFNIDVKPLPDGSLSVTGTRLTDSEVRA